SSTAGAIVGVQFVLDGVNLGAEDTVSPYSINWDTTTATPGTHFLSAIARDTLGNTNSASSRMVSIDTTAPTVSMTAPLNGDSVGGVSVVLAVHACLHIGVLRV